MILCLGTTPVYQRSMVFEKLVPHDVNRSTGVHDYASGKAINVARVLHTLGEDVLATGFAGGGRGTAMLADLDRAGVPHDFVRVTAQTRQCITVIDRAAATATELVEESAAAGPVEWEVLGQKLADLIPKAKGCVFSGSLPPKAPEDFYLSCLRRAAAGVPVVVDARGAPLGHALRHPGVVAKLNRDELAATFADPIDTDARLVALMLQLTPPGGFLVVTSGPEGALSCDGKYAWRVRPPRVETRSAVGSGDAFAAGMMRGMLLGQSPAEACAFGAACGAANAMTDLAGHLSRADVDALLPRVRVEPL